LIWISGALWLIFKLFEEISYKYWGSEKESIHRIFRCLTNVTEFMAYAISFITLVFAVYIYILR